MKAILNGLKYWIVVVSCLSSGPVVAHQLSTAYLNIDVANHSNQLSGQMQWRFFDLEKALGLDSDLDGNLRWYEVLQNQSRIISYATNKLSISSGQRSCPIVFNDLLRADTHFDEGYLVLDFAAQCSEEIIAQSLQINYQGVFDQDPNHKMILNIQGMDAGTNPTFSTVLESDSRNIEFDPRKNYVYDTFSTYLYQGIVHIFIGIDHILFLVVLMMTCVLYRDQGKWLARQDFKQVFKSAAWIVTAFTLAHSITLTATVVEWISPNSRWVEVGIALSVLITAANNIWPLLLRMGWITFAFGLLHGMGFASVLAELGLSPEHQIISILAFNLGVEVGQIAILLLVLPVFFVLRHRRFYQTIVLRAGSLIIGLIALGWTIERI